VGQSAVLQKNLVKDENMDEFPVGLWLATSTKDSIGFDFQSSPVG
jgi:hypothetical protein